MLSFFDRLWKVVECYVYEASFRKQFPNQFFLGFLIWAHGSTKSLGTSPIHFTLLTSSKWSTVEVWENASPSKRSASARRLKRKLSSLGYGNPAL